MDKYKFEVKIFGENDRLESYHYYTVEANTREEADLLIKEVFPNYTPELVQIDDAEQLSHNSLPKKRSKGYRTFHKRY